MARPLRLEFAGAVYHLTARVNAQQAIYRDDMDRCRVLATLAHAVDRYGWRVYADCLMDNHHHPLEYIIARPDPYPYVTPIPTYRAMEPTRKRFELKMGPRFRTP